VATATRALTFDVDGTLYDVRRQKLRIVPQMLRHPLILSGFKETVEEMRGEKVDNFRAELARRLGARVGVADGKVRQVLNHVVFGAWPASFNERTPFRGVHEALSSIRLPRAVVSDYDPDEKLRRMGLDHGWSALISCERLGALKPLPDGLLAAAEKMGVKPSEILHIGDRADTDEAMALAAGARCWLLGRDFKSWRELSKKLAAQGATP
jgi:putative hydrolase of the HAD superfamily